MKTVEALIILILLSALATVGTTSCSEPPPLKLTLKQRDWVDTIYLKRVDSLRIALDSLCTANYEEKVTRLTDSLVAVRRAEEEALRQKYLRQQQPQ